MDRKHFEGQIERLRNQWTNAYGDERVARIWLTFKNVDDGVFTEIVNLALDKSRAAPLVDELAAFEQELKQRKAQYRGQYQTGSVMGVLEKAARQNKRADPEFVSACMDHLGKKLDGKLTPEQFLQGCEYLDTTAKHLEGRGSEITTIPVVDQKTKAAGGE